MGRLAKKWIVATLIAATIPAHAAIINQTFSITTAGFTPFSGNPGAPPVGQPAPVPSYTLVVNLTADLTTATPSPTAVTVISSTLPIDTPLGFAYRPGGLSPTGDPNVFVVASDQLVFFPTGPIGLQSGTNSVFVQIVNPFSIYPDILDPNSNAPEFFGLEYTTVNSTVVYRSGFNSNLNGDNGTVTILADTSIPEPAPVTILLTALLAIRRRWHAPFQRFSRKLTK